jgi:hypothetical protein
MEPRREIQRYILAWLIIIGFIGLTGYLLHLSDSGKTLADTTGSVFMLLGTIATAFGIVIQYFFGSTKASGEKTDQLIDLAKNSTPIKKEEECKPS